MIEPSTEVAAARLLAKIQSGTNASNAKQYLQDYGFARLWALTLKMVNCDPEKKDLLVEIKCEMRSLLLLMQEHKIDLNDAEMASKKLKELYQGKM